jgi:rare lipoprotein A
MYLTGSTKTVLSIVSGITIILAAGARGSAEANSRQDNNDPGQSDEKTAVKNTFSGNCSWYGKEFDGRKTASGEIFDIRKATAAHRRLPFYTKVLIENPKTGKSCIIKINDRGPFVKTRVLDLSPESMRRVAPGMPGLIYADCLVLDQHQ